MCSKTLKLVPVFAMALLAAIQSTRAEQPLGCSGAGVTLKLDVFFADGLHPAAGQTLAPCETIVYRSQLCQSGGTSCDITGGTLSLTTQGGAVTDVTPPGGIGTLSGGACAAAVTTTITLNGSLDAPATLTYNGFTFTGPGTTPVPVTISIGIDNTVAPCPTSPDLCNPIVCDPTAHPVDQPYRTGACVTQPVVCPDPCSPCVGGVCTPVNCPDPCSPCVGGVCTPVNCPDPCFPCDPATGACSTTTHCGNAGCTPGFFKNCTTQWPTSGCTVSCDGTIVGTTTISTSTMVSSIFCIPACLADCKPSLDTTLLKALSFQGGSTLCGGAQTLIRAGVAAYLNSLRVNYPLTCQQVITQVNAALASCDRATIIALAATLDKDNNLGCVDANGTALPCKVK